MDTSTRLVPRWKRAPGYDRLLDAADEAARADAARGADHRHRIEANSKGGIDFRGNYCRELADVLWSIESESNRTCQKCGDPGYEHPSRSYEVLCDRHAQAG
jgi:hypothetical protein